MIRLPPDFKEFLKLLNSRRVEYLLVGGYAVGFHGYSRPTGDLDVWIAVSPENAERVRQALVEFGFSQENVPANLFTDPDRIVRMGVPPVRLEIITAISGVDFALYVLLCGVILRHLLDDDERNLGLQGRGGGQGYRS